MQISTYARYGLRAIIRLALITNSGKKVASIKEIAENENISAKYLEAIFSRLKKSKYILSFKGKQGGYRLNRHPNDITVFEIVELLDRKIAPLNCLINSKECPYNPKKCTVLNLWKELDYSIKTILENKTLQDLMDEYKKID